MKYFTLIFAFCTSLNYAFNQKELSSSQEKAIELHDLGYLTSLTGNHEKAIEYYTQSIKFDSLWIGNYIDRGNSYREIGQFSKAENDFKKVISLKSEKVFQGYNNLGILYKKQKRYSEALVQYNEAINLKSDCFECYYNRAQLYELQKNNKEAMLDYNYAIKFKSDYSNAYYNRGCLKYAGKDFEGAISDYTQALKHNPQKIEEVRYNRGMCYSVLKQYENAKPDFEFFVSKIKTNADAFYNLAICYYNLNEFNNACVYAKKSLSLGKENAQILINETCK